MLEATALPTEPQPLPFLFIVYEPIFERKSFLLRKVIRLQRVQLKSDMFIRKNENKQIEMRSVVSLNPSTV